MRLDRETQAGPDDAGLGTVPGGTSPAAVRRVAEHGSGWICGLGGAAGFAQTAELVRERWRRAGRDGAPRLLSIVNFALGRGAPGVAEGFLRRYYGAAPFVDGMVRDTPTTLDGVRAVLDAHREAGCDELLLFPCASERSQLELAAEAL